MTRFTSWFALALGFSVVSAAADPKKNVKDDEVYYPTRAETRFTYSAGNGDITEKIVKVERQKDGSRILTVALEFQGQFGPFVVESRRIQVSKDGLYSLSNGKHDLSEPSCFFKMPVKPGEKWESKYTLQGFQYKASLVAHEAEKVVVPAGQFMAVRIDSETTRGDQPPTKSSMWYAPGVGFVKSVTGNTVTVLKSFDPGE